MIRLSAAPLLTIAMIYGTACGASPEPVPVPAPTAPAALEIESSAGGGVSTASATGGNARLPDGHTVRLELAVTAELAPAD